jgi:type 1 fimbria pilin
MKPLLIALAVFTWVNTAQAASGIDLNVTGLVTPSACEPSLSNGGLYDLGKIAARELTLDAPTVLPPHSLQLTINCEASTLLALEPRDNRLGSSYAGDQSFKFGLGLINGGWAP